MQILITFPDSCWLRPFSELRTRFGAASWETQVLRGEWEGRSTLYHDNLTRFFVDVPDEPEHRQFFKGFKELLKQRFQQADVWITSLSHRCNLGRFGKGAAILPIRRPLQTAPVP